MTTACAATWSGVGDFVDNVDLSCHLHALTITLAWAGILAASIGVCAVFTAPRLAYAFRSGISGAKKQMSTVTALAFNVVHNASWGVTALIKLSTSESIGHDLPVTLAYGVGWLLFQWTAFATIWTWVTLVCGSSMDKTGVRETLQKMRARFYVAYAQATVVAFLPCAMLLVTDDASRVSFEDNCYEGRVVRCTANCHSHTKWMTAQSFAHCRL